MCRDFRREINIDEILSESSVRIASFLALSTPGPDEKAARHELLFRLARYIEQLPQDQRDVINLRDLHGYRVDQIAEMLGKTQKAIAGLLLRGRLELRKFAKEIGLEPL